MTTDPTRHPTADRPPLTRAERERFVEELYPTVRRFCQRIARPEDADDILQNAMVTAWLKADSFDPTLSGSKLSWAYRIARNFAMKARDKRKRYATPFSDVSVPDDVSFDPPARASDDAPAVTAAAIHGVREATARLPRGERRVIADRYGRGMPVLDVAAKLGVTRDVVENTTRRALYRLRTLVRVPT